MIVTSRFRVTVTVGVFVSPGLSSELVRRICERELHIFPVFDRIRKDDIVVDVDRLERDLDSNDGLRSLIGHSVASDPVR